MGPVELDLQVVRQALRLPVNRLGEDVESVERHSAAGGHPIDGRELLESIAVLGEPLVPTPREEFDLVPLDVIEGGNGAEAVVPLWTANGRSRLGLRVRIFPEEWGTMAHQVLGVETIEDLDYTPQEEVLRLKEAADRERAVKTERDLAARRAQQFEGQRADVPVPEMWRAPLGDLVRRLTIKDYAGLAADGYVGDPSDVEDGSFGYWLDQYPHSIIEMPDQAWDFSETLPMADGSDCWTVLVRLWTQETGRSDLTMEVHVDASGQPPRFSIVSVHPM